MALGIRNAFASIRNAFDANVARDLGRSGFPLMDQRPANAKATGTRKSTAAAIFAGTDLEAAFRVARREHLDVTWVAGRAANGFGGAYLGFPFAVMPSPDRNGFIVVVGKTVADVREVLPSIPSYPTAIG